MDSATVASKVRQQSKAKQVYTSPGAEVTSSITDIVKGFIKEVDDMISADITSLKTRKLNQLLLSPNITG